MSGRWDDRQKGQDGRRRGWRSRSKSEERESSLHEHYADRAPHREQRERRKSYEDGSRRPRDSGSAGTKKERSRSPYQHHRSRKREYSDDERPSRHHRGSTDDYHRSKRRRPSSPSASPPSHRNHPAHSSTSSSRQQPKKPQPPSPQPYKRSLAPLPSQEAAFTGITSDLPTAQPPSPKKQTPNLAPSGKLAAETNTVAGTSIVLKYHEPPEARLPPPSSPWRMYVFKGASSTPLDTLELAARSCWLFGRERSVVDFATEHPSCSKQHAVVQFRFVGRRKNEYGDGDGDGKGEGKVRPYVIDLESANGTKVNGERVPEGRYVQLRSGDVLTFGESSREYVLMLPPSGAG